MNLKFKTFYIAGSSKSYIYLGNISLPEQVYFIGDNLKIADSLKIDVFSTKKTAWRALKVSIDSPVVYLYEGIIPSVFKGSIHTNNFDRLDFSNTYFDKAYQISSNSIVARSFDAKLNQNLLRKLSIDFPSKKPYILKKQKEGFFSTDGILLYNNQLNQVFYIYHYRNMYVSLDTLLNENYIGHTIDTITNPNIRIGKIKSQNSFKLLGHPQVVNKHASTYNNRLYVHSTLKSDNEQHSNFNDLIAIDVYDIVHNKYLFSFYILKYRNLKLNEFKVIDNKLIAFFENYLVSYNLTELYN